MKLPNPVKLGRLELVVSTVGRKFGLETMVFRKDDRGLERGTFGPYCWEDAERAEEAHGKIVNLMRLMSTMRKTLSPEAATAFDEMVLTRFDPSLNTN